MQMLHKWEHRPSTQIGAAFSSKSSNRAAQRGIAYHRKFYRELKALEDSGALDFRLLVEPWFRNLKTKKMCSPDTVLIDESDNTGIVVEVKMNWKDGRDEKLINQYLPVVKTAFGLDQVWPLLVTSNVRGYEGKPLLWNRSLDPLCECLSWHPGSQTPVALYV